MKTQTKKPIFYIAVCIALAAFNIVGISSGATDLNIESRSLPGDTCYQTMGYCGAWNLTMKCNLNKTAQLCSIYECRNCDPN